MSKPNEQNKSTKYANIDMDKFKFDFNLFVPNIKTSAATKDEKQDDK